MREPRGIIKITVQSDLQAADWRLDSARNLYFRNSVLHCDDTFPTLKLFYNDLRNQIQPELHRQ